LKRAYAQSRRLPIVALITGGAFLPLLCWLFLTPHSLWAQDAPPVITVPTPPLTTVQAPLVLATDEDPTQQALGALMSLLLIEQGLPVTHTTFIDSQRLLTAIDQGEVDLAIARPVDALTRHYALPLNALPTDGKRLQQLVDSQAMKAGSTWLTPTLLSQNYALFTIDRAEEAAQQSSSISLPQLESFQKSTNSTLTLCADERDSALFVNTLTALEESYELTFAEAQQQLLPTAALSQTIATGNCDLLFARADAYANDPVGIVRQAVPDPDQFFPPNQLTLVAQRALLAANPAISRDWAALTARVDESTVAQFLATASPTDNDDNKDDAGATTNQLHFDPTLGYQFLLNHDLIQLPTITVISREETTQQLLSSMVVHLLQAAGYPVVDETGTLGASNVIESVKNEERDIAIALLGDLLPAQSPLTGATLPMTVTEAMALIRGQARDQALAAMDPAPFSLTKVLIVDEDLAGLGITTISRLATYMNSFESPFSLCIDSDFFSHPRAGLSGLEEFYGFHFDPNKILLMDEDTIFPAIQEGECQVTVGTITDGRVAAWQLLPLHDDQGFFPLNNPLPIMRQPLLEEQPRLAAALQSYLPYLDTATMQELTTLVELGADGIYLSGDEEAVTTVAKSFLTRHQLIDPTQASDNIVEGNPVGENGRIEIDALDAEQLDEFEELPDLPNALRLNE